MKPKHKIRILFIVPYPTEGASNRLRVEQYLPFLKSHSMEFIVRPFASRSFFKILYKKGFYFLKIYYFIIATINRIVDLLRVIKYDIIFIHREAFPIGPAIFEYIFATSKKPIIYDFDDAIFLPNISKSNSFMERFKMPNKISKIIRISKAVIAGNEYLGKFALKYNQNVSIIPTPINTDAYKPKFSETSRDSEVVIGWIGTPTTVCFVYSLEGVFRRVLLKYPNVKFKIIGGEFSIPGLDKVMNENWTLREEADLLGSFDIGVMPMPDNEWTRGKCGFKVIIYMSMGIPAVCSPVGMNKEIIQDGVNGFLADSQEDWLEKLSALIEDRQLRENIGRAGRHSAEEKYSVKVNAPKFFELIQKVYNEAQ
ncbi:MAG: glycosyltransferase family 4 protein [Candidatus Omnitrophota bacterium]